MGDHLVSSEDTAEALGSGEVPVLGTPRLLAWLEAETCEVVRPLLQPGQTTVGTHVEIEHLAASAVGSQVTVIVSIEGSDECHVAFVVRAEERSSGRVLAQGRITRAIVDRDRFLARAGTG